MMFFVNRLTCKVSIRLFFLLCQLPSTPCHTRVFSKLKSLINKGINAFTALLFRP